jgi:hypothetical protein
MLVADLGGAFVSMVYLIVKHRQQDHIIDHKGLDSIMPRALRALNRLFETGKDVSVSCRCWRDWTLR